MMAQEIYVVIEFDRETHEFSEIEAIYQSKEEAENLVKEYNAKFLRYSYEWFEETYHAEAVKELYEKNEELRHQKYKRCLAMADYCYTNVHCIMGHRLCALSDRKKEWFERWHKRWLELAEKFKEAK